MSLPRELCRKLAVVGGTPEFAQRYPGHMLLDTKSSDEPMMHNEAIYIDTFISPWMIATQQSHSLRTKLRIRLSLA